MKTSLKCNCGHRILQRDVMRQGYYMGKYGPSYVYIRYRCSHCKKLDQRFIKQEDWEDGMLSEITNEASEPERKRFSNLGTITLNEMRDFHHALERLNQIPDLLKEE